MNLVGIIELGNVKALRSTLFDGCNDGIENIESYDNGNSFSFSILDILVVDKLLTRVRTLTNDLMAFRILLNGHDVDVTQLR